MFNFFNSLNRDNLSDIKETVNKINSLEEKWTLLLDELSETS